MTAEKPENKEAAGITPEVRETPETAARESFEQVLVAPESGDAERIDEVRERLAQQPHPEATQEARPAKAVEEQGRNEASTELIREAAGKSLASYGEFRRMAQSPSSQWNWAMQHRENVDHSRRNMAAGVGGALASAGVIGAGVAPIALGSFGIDVPVLFNPASAALFELPFAATGLGAIAAGAAASALVWTGVRVAQWAKNRSLRARGKKLGLGNFNPSIL